MSHATDELVIVAAVARNGVIGKSNALPWHIPGELEHFRAVTTKHAVIMGRKTFESIGKPLPNRRNIVITRDRSLLIEGCETASSLTEAIAMARASDNAPRVIGGAQIYAEALPLATELVLTEIDRDYEGDAYFPAVDRAVWREERRVAHSEPGVSFCWYRRG
jgi:dihydrofolate reductase